MCWHRLLALPICRPIGEMEISLGHHATLPWTSVLSAADENLRLLLARWRAERDTTPTSWMRAW